MRIGWDPLLHCSLCWEWQRTARCFKSKECGVLIISFKESCPFHSLPRFCVLGSKVWRSRLKTAPGIPLILSYFSSMSNHVMLEQEQHCQHSTQCLSDSNWSSSATVVSAFVTIDGQGLTKLLDLLGKSMRSVMKGLLTELSFKFEESKGGCR